MLKYKLEKNVSLLYCEVCGTNIAAKQATEGNKFKGIS